MKYAGLLITVISSLCLAVSITNRSKRRIELIKKLSDFFHALSFSVAVEPYEAVESVKRLIADGRYGELDFVKSFADSFTAGADVKSLWQDSLVMSSAVGKLPEKAVEVLKAFSSVFGKNTVGSFRGRCTVAEKELDAVYVYEKKRFEKNGGIMFALCMSFGAMLTIIFI